MCPSPLLVRGMGAVIGNLRCEPMMERRDERGVGGGVADLSTMWYGRVLHVDLCRPGFQIGQSRHILPVDRGWIAEIATAELDSLLLKMRLDQRDLLRVRWVVGRYGLQPAIWQLLEHVGGLLKVEGHHLGAARCHLSLATTRREHPGAVQDANHDDDSEHDR